MSEIIQGAILLAGVLATVWISRQMRGGKENPVITFARYAGYGIIGLGLGTFAAFLIILWVPSDLQLLRQVLGVGLIVGGLAAGLWAAKKWPNSLSFKDK